jgi:hypothetical protein
MVGKANLIGSTADNEKETLGPNIKWLAAIHGS